MELPMMKQQSAMEYLLTYGWAILIIAIAVVVIFQIASPSSAPIQQCVLPAGLNCLNYYLAPNGLLTLSMLQSTTSPINITAMGCSSPANTMGMTITNAAFPLNGKLVPVNSNFSFSVQCYANGTKASGTAGTLYAGYIVVNYTNSYTNIPQTVFGKLTTKFQ